MKTIYFDTEFTGLVVDPCLISIGLVDESGEQTFYGELTDSWRLEDAGDFVRAAVVPLLEGGDVLMSMEQLQTALRAWIESFEEPVQLATDSIAWDWPWVHEIFHDGTWPANLARKPLLLAFDHDQETQVLSYNTAVERCYKNGFRRHHALDDARANRAGWLAAQDRRHV